MTGVSKVLEGSILVIDDEEVICNFIKDALSEKGYSVVFATEAKKGFELAKLNYFDVVFVDLRMPEVNGLAVLQQLKRFDPDNVVIMITGYPSFETVKEAMYWGAFDYISKPFDLETLLFTTKRAVNFRRLNEEKKKLMEQIKQENIMLDKKVQERTEELRNMYRRLQMTFVSTIKALAKALEARDSYTRSHSENVTKYAVMIAQEMKLSEREIGEIKNACELHDLGKIGVHDYILTKTEELTPQEWEEIKLHSLKSVEILKPLDFLDEVMELIRQHHERYDGTGYPDGLKGEAIKLGARIIAVADTFDAMTSKRPYREKVFTKQEAIEEIKKKSGTQFDPRVVEAFLRIVDKL
ncbi:MAG: response regulator [Candidatus Omnitrophica bacterium]|nr:response regulator [Candidatus Omnitrophota bacterium]